MASFSKDEIFTATEVVRNFSSILSKVGENKRIVILKNNKFEAVMLNLKEYERLLNAVELLENIYKHQKA
ncbi:type II toxin-antitoxin system Phd/YefM family antitoxin [Campylobacter troglodytis]|uniref:type II toxin-antitoxin system Phd/YefM family antitoxin n=1 Tax=Campylobacter troglodytis TaxID=654363 RepID=UPI001157B1D5|nr:type II toxin-antitoxin system Phd/YefM family antitoxin [Campylobacter troglodytis]TQR61173.1 prevent-host-death protein [Campylobacter troglodytis]